MDFTEFLIKRPVLSIVMTIIIIMIGAVSYSRLTLRQYPEVDKPVISVTTILAGASPEIIEQQLTRPLEEALGGIEGLDFMTSRSNPEESVVKLHFRIDRDIDTAAADVRDRLQKAQRDLPDEAETPLIRKADADAIPIIYLSLYSDKKSVGELADYANKYLKSEIETIAGVASADVRGGGELEMHLILDPVKLDAYKVTATDVAAALKRQNVTKPVGRVVGDEREYSLTTVSKLSTPAQFNNMVIKESEGAVVRLKEVGYAELKAVENREASRYNDKNAVSIEIVKKSVANPLAVKAGLLDKLEQIRKRLPSGSFIEISSDNTVFIEKSIDHVRDTIRDATILVILVVFAFLASFRAALIPLVTIPVSLIGSFFLMFLFGFTINILTLLALVLAIGLVVDDAIVVLENIYRYIEEGMKPMKAAIIGTKEISFAVIAMTLTLAAVYAPIALSTGITGKFFTEFALTLAGAVLISGFVALTLTPMMCSRLLVAHNQQKHSTNKIGHFFNVWSDKTVYWLDKLDAAYGSFLPVVLSRRILVVGAGAAVALIGLYLALFQIRNELTPQEDQGEFLAFATPPYGATLKYVDKYAKQVDQILASVPELVKRMTIVDTADDSTFKNTMVPWEKRSRNCTDIKKILEPEFDKIIGLDVRGACPRSQLSAGGIFDFNFVIQTTRSLQDLEAQMFKIWSMLSRHPGLANIRPDAGDVVQDYKVEVDIDKAVTLGIEPDLVARTLDDLIGGRRPTTFERENKKYYVKVWIGEKFRRSPQDILSMTVKGTRDGKDTFVPLSDIVKIVPKQGTSEIAHFEGLRSVTFKALVNQGYGLGQVLEDVKAASNQILPDGYSTTVTGQTRDYLNESYTLYIIFGLAISFIFLVMAAQFESFVDPFIIILSVPLSLAGAILTLWLFNQTLNIYSQIGLVTLIGLITKHGILIVDFANKLQEQGKEQVEAVIEASRLRLRPILMTTFAMVFGAIPLAFSSGAGAETRSQIGLVIVGGMSLGTLFTLFVIPVVYTYLNRKKVPIVIE